jgi:hypothetical protein
MISLLDKQMTSYDGGDTQIIMTPHHHDTSAPDLSEQTEHGTWTVERKGRQEGVSCILAGKPSDTNV